VRWPARPAEHRAGLEFSFVSFLCFKTKKRKEVSVVTFLFYVLSFACAKERTKEKHTGNDPDSYRDSRCRRPD
jgi:hypothetical protein